MEASSSPPSSPSPSFSDLPTTVHPDPSLHQDSCTLDDDFEFALLLPLSPSRACPRTAANVHPPAEKAQPLRAHRTPHSSTRKTHVADYLAGSRRGPAPAAYRRLRRAPDRCLRWYELAFGSVRVPAVMDMADIKNRLGRRRPGEEEVVGVGEGWAPWKLIRSLSCKGVESAAVAVAAAPVRLV